MIKCRDCNASQYEGALFCSECGRFLLETAEQMTDQLPFSEFAYYALPPPLIEQKLELTQETKQITFIIPSSRHRLTMKLADQIRIGRADSQSGIQPELDLTHDNGAERGISRTHAILQLFKQGVVITDLGSTNGTFLNNYRLPAEKPYVVRSGDEIRFGDLLVHVFFE